MITVIQKPQKYTPSNDAIIFQVESNNSNLVYFKVEVLEAVSNAVITETEIYPFPNYQNGSYINLSRILENTVKWEVNNSINQLTVPLSRPVLNYKIKLTERGIVSGLMADLSPAVTLPDTFFIWNAELGRFRFFNYNYTNYTITSGLPVKFLTYKPNGSTVNDLSSEQLYFLHDNEDVLNVVIKTYNTSETLINTYTDSISGLSTHKMFRIQVSPKTLLETLLVDFRDVDFYTVQLTDENGDIKTEARKYFYRSIPCSVKVQNILWVNSLGGLDSYQFVNVTETNNITRNTIKKNPYQISNGFYTDRQAEIMNASEEVIDVAQEGNYTANTQFLNDAESVWLNELFISKAVFVELADGSLVPVIITNNSYQIQKQFLNKSGYNSTQVTYQLNGQLIPSEASASSAGFGSGGIQLDFIDSQMNFI